MGVTKEFTVIRISKTIREVIKTKGFKGESYNATLTRLFSKSKKRVKNV